MGTPYNIDATVYVYRHVVTNELRCEYREQAIELERPPDWWHVATVEPRLWILAHWDEAEE